MTLAHKKKFLRFLPADNVAPKIKRIFKSALQYLEVHFFCMTCKEIIKYLEDWAPKEIAWQNDNVGIQVGNTSRKVTNILLSLELTAEVVNQAIKKNCNLIITHHPLIFHPIKKLDLNKRHKCSIDRKAY